MTVFGASYKPVLAYANWHLGWVGVGGWFEQGWSIAFEPVIIDERNRQGHAKSY